VPPSDFNGHATIAPYGTFSTADGFVNVCVGNDAQFVRMCAALGRDDLAADPRFATNPLRVRNKPALIDEIMPALARMTVHETLAAFEASGVPVGPVDDIGQVLDDPTTRGRRMVLEFNRDDVGSARVVNTPWKIDGATATVRLPPPHLGEHNDDVLPPAPDRAQGNR
jgi:formyl-CoA transferase